MAMTLRLDEAHDQLLEVLAAKFGRSKTEVVQIALDDLAARADKSARTRAAFDRVRSRDAELLERLAR
ncbi:toxin-antitoxin system protein [Agromyces aurantiacus]|uniref:Toxin-antitoxin system protein n=1 Tax=Agromyces aurantiacus TaxID=165814 RepID=A0ABV9R5T3_9MICO|nr:DNA-binding protein [Agromyces aurantiacus]MBM7503758.1 putative transcriptional regulator [Agromyces aurantiacus]